MSPAFRIQQYPSVGFRIERLLYAALVLLPPVGIWWVFRPGFSWFTRWLSLGWCFAWIVLYRLLPFTIPDGVRNLVFFATLVSGGAVGALWLLGTTSKGILTSEVHAAEEQSNTEFKEIIEVGELPVIEDDSIQLDHEEFICYRESAFFLEYRTSGRTYSSGRSWRGWMGNRIQGVSQRDMTETLQKVDQGVVYITNKRLLYMGQSRTLTQYHHNIQRVQIGGPRVAILNINGKAKNVGIEVPNAWKVVGFHRYLSVHHLRDRRLVEE